MDLGLSDRVAIVAASSQGIGKAVAWGLAREGVKLALCARTESVLLTTAEEIRRETGTELMARVVDVTAPEQVHWFVGEAARRFGRLDICVANAGGPPSKSFADTSIEDWHRQSSWKAVRPHWPRRCRGVQNGARSRQRTNALVRVPSRRPPGLLTPNRFRGGSPPRSGAAPIRCVHKAPV